MSMLEPSPYKDIPPGEFVPGELLEVPNRSPSAAPTPKVLAQAGGAGVGGAIGAVVVWALAQAGVDAPPEIGIAISTICSVVIGFAAGYFTPPRVS